VAMVILLATVKWFRFTNLLYVLMFLHSLVLLYGAHYAYSGVPLGRWMSNVFGWERNNYDKIGHFMQGFCPVMIAREIIIRKSPLKKGIFLPVLSWCVAMTVSAIYEIIEWLLSASAPEDTEAFLGTQGYIYDTQSDMLMCFIRAIVALVLFSYVHNREIANLEKYEKKDGVEKLSEDASQV